MREQLEDLVGEIDADNSATDIDMELVSEAKHWVATTKPGKQPTVSQFTKSCDMSERLLKRQPREETKERIRRFLVILVVPMRITEVIQSVQDKPIPDSVSELAREFFGSRQSTEGGDPEGDEELPLWYSGKMGAREAESILAGKVDGTYIIRESETSPGDHNITIRDHNMVYHYRIVKTVTGLYLHPDEVFASLWELVAHYQEHDGTIPNHQFPVRLRFPFSSYASNPWYHGEIKKAGAEDMLRPARDGSFLVRQSQSGDGDLTLSLRVHDELHHYRIIRNDDKTFSLSKDIRFQTLEKLIQFYAREEGGGIPTLRKALAREPDRVVDPDQGENEYTYINLTVKAKGSSVRPTGFLGTGFGRSGFYQRRWVQSLRNKKGKAV
mmetsp:Transcript_24835/g.34868  ORF Transcript_24835/g.34868 Transcript_24835/m.34868 type:complete len:383 (-) Transcript_24835:411-1559(-)